MKNFPLIVNSSTADGLAISYARISLPLERGEYLEMPAITASTRGQSVPAQAEVLARWPDSSVRICHVIAPLRGGDGCIELAQDGSTPDAAPTLEVRREGETCVVKSGDMRVVLGGGKLVQSISLREREFIGAGDIKVLVTDGQGRVFRAGACREVKMEIETQGALRAVISLRGKCTLDNQTFLDFRLRFEFLAGVEGFSLAFAFFNLERGADFHNLRALELQLNLQGAAQVEYSVCQVNHGIFGASHVATTREAIHINVDNSQVRPYVENFETLGDETDYPFYLENGKADVENWAAISDGARALIFGMDDFHLLRPKNLRLENGGARFGIWPEEAGVLPLQQGRSREVTVRVALCDASTPLTRADATSRIAQLRDVWRAQLKPEIYAQAKFFDQSRVLAYDAERRPRFEGWLARVSSVQSVAAFFDLGDTPDSGYRSTYTPLGRQKRVRGEDGGTRWFSSGYGHPALAMNDMEDFEPVWVNNEYDVIFAFGTEYLRTADRTLFQRLQWFARHTIEVDFLHYSDHKWLHRAQPAHSARHTTTGAYPSHFWTQGLAQYYMLTGDPDALEVIIALADKTIENFEDPELGKLHGGLNREVGWGILSLVCAYEASGDKRFDDYARKLLADVIVEGLPHDLPVFSFGHTSMLLAARQYLQVHEGESNEQKREFNHNLQHYFLSWVKLGIACSRRAPEAAAPEHAARSGTYDYTIRTNAKGALWAQKPRRGIFDLHSIALDCLAYAYEMTGDEAYIRAGLRTLEALLESPAFPTPLSEGKPFAMMYRTWIDFLQAAAQTGYLRQWEYLY